MQAVIAKLKATLAEQQQQIEAYELQIAQLNSHETAQQVQELFNCFLCLIGSVLCKL